jgi:hypothetical protein
MTPIGGRRPAGAQGPPPFNGDSRHCDRERRPLVTSPSLVTRRRAPRCLAQGCGGAPLASVAEFAPSGGCTRTGHRNHGLPPRTAEAVTSDHEQATAIPGRRGDDARQTTACSRFSCHLCLEAITRNFSSVAIRAFAAEFSRSLNRRSTAVAEDRGYGPERATALQWLDIRFSPWQ